MAASPQDELARLYKSVATKLTQTLTEAKRRGVAPPNKNYIVGQLRELAAQMTDLDARTAKWVERHVSQEYLKSAGQAQQTLAQTGAGGLVTSPRFTGVEARAMRALELRITRDLRQVREAIATGLALNDPNRQGLATCLSRAEDGFVQRWDPMRQKAAADADTTP